MEPDELFTEVQSGLKERKSDWPRISEETGVSTSWLEKVAGGYYKSDPTYKRLSGVAQWLRANPLEQRA